MRHLSLDGYAEAVKDFVRQLSAEAGTSVLELEGRAVIYVLAAVSANDTPDEEPWTEAKNARRCELIDKEIDGTLAIEEVAELEQLERAAQRELQRVAPLPLKDARALYNELLAKAQGATGTR